MSFSKAKQLWAFLCFGIALLAPLTAGADVEPILKVDLATDSTVPGQPIVLRVTVLVPTWLPQPPVFPNFEVPNLQVRLPERASGPTSQTVDGETWSGVSRAYRLYPMTVGRFQIAPQSLIVTFADLENQKPVRATLRTPEIVFAGVAPEGGADLDPFIAAQALSLEQTVEGDLEELEPGNAIVRTVKARITGTSPLFLPPLLSASNIEGIAAYPKEPALTEAEDRSELSGERLESVTYIAQVGGEYTLPAIKLDWFNLDSGQIETAELDSVAFTIAGTPPASEPEQPAQRSALLVGLALLVLMAIGWLAWRSAPKLVAWWSQRQTAWRSSERFAFEAAWTALRARDLAAALNAKAVWDRRLPPVMQPAETELSQALTRLGAVEYGRMEGVSGAQDWKAAMAALKRARQSRLATVSAGSRSALPPLNPARPRVSPFQGAVLVLLSISAATFSNGVAATPAYVGSAVCADCHAVETKAWQGSHHELAWTEPKPQNVLGDFDDRTFSHNGLATRFMSEAESFFVETDGPDGELTRYRVMGVAGIAPLQQYLVEIEPGRIQALDIAWDVEQQRWYHLYPQQEVEAGDGLHWTGPFKSWNARCAECHATGFEKNYDADTRQYQSRQAEIGVGCEACHGPGEAHVAWASGETAAPMTQWPGLSERGFTIAFGATAAKVEIEQCAACHSRREPFLDSSPLPGTAFDDAYRLSLLREGLYHPDGTILDEVYVYGSFLQSKMHSRGVRCSDCHEPHSAELRAQGNAVCTQCHSAAGIARFPTLGLGEFDAPSHHFHEAGTAGANCQSCHMVERVYMGIDWRRDHSFRIPRPDLSVETGAPNACTDCHTDRDAEWAAAEVARRFPDTDHTGTHFSQVFAAARLDPAAAAPDLISIAGDLEEPGIIRATALELLMTATSESVARGTAELLSDPDPLVRAAAVGVQRGATPMNRVQRLVPLLDDERRSVRMAAAREFLDAPIARLPAGIEEDWRAAIGEWRASLLAKTDFPETHLAVGGSALVMRNFAAAEAAFREAVFLDPQQVPAWRMIARIRAASGDRDGAVEALDDALAANPDNPILTVMREQF